ncbi:MAG: hypothetical protein VX730_07760 [Pseudomonadota bacterium]|nr:hypothetical protein [Pseudomonadota bacterium]
MKKLLTVTALTGLLVLTGCGDDEETKQKARIEANAALLKSQQLQIDATVPQIADLTAQLEALQTELATAESTIAAKNAAEARLAELRSESAELEQALNSIEEFQARAKLVNPDGDGILKVNPVRKNGNSMRTARYVDPDFNTLMYRIGAQGSTILLDSISATASARIQECINGNGCLAPSASTYAGSSSTYRIIDWDAGLVVYGFYSGTEKFEIRHFEEFGEEFATRMHAEADLLRSRLTSQ